MTKEKQAIVYLYTFPNGKYYVGKTRYPDVRCLYYKQYGKNQPVYKALKKAQENGDTVDLRYLSEYVDDKVASSIEKHNIALYRTNINRYGDEFGYNLTDGGEGTFGYKPPPKTDEHRANISAAMTGNKNPMKKHEVKSLMSLTQQLHNYEKLLDGIKPNPEINAIRAAKSKAMWQDPEFRARRKVSLAKVMATDGWKAKQRAGYNTPECRAKRRGDNNPSKKHENKTNISLSKQLHFHEKRLEKAGLIPKMV